VPLEATPLADAATVWPLIKRAARRTARRRRLQYLDYWRGGVGVDAFYSLHYVAGHGEDAFAAGGVFAHGSYGLAAVAADADLGVNFDFAQEWDAEELGHAAAFAVAEDVDAAFAMGAAEVTHVFDDAKNLDVNLAEHFNGFAYVGEGDDRGRGDDDGACDGDALNERELYVTCARGKIDDEVIEFAPLHAAEKLLDDAVKHGAAPDERLIARIQQAHRDHFDSVGFDGDDGALVEGAGLFDRAEHDGDVGAVDVGVEEADFCAEGFEGEGEIHGDGRLADAAFTAGYGDEIFDAGNWSFFVCRRLIRADSWHLSWSLSGRGRHWFLSNMGAVVNFNHKLVARRRQGVTTEQVKSP